METESRTIEFSVSCHTNHPDLVSDLGNLADGQGALACAEEVFPSLRSVTLVWELGTVRST